MERCEDTIFVGTAKIKIVMKKINVAELLKDCPKGMELDCTIFNCVVFHLSMYDIYEKSMYPSIKI